MVASRTWTYASYVAEAIFLWETQPNQLLCKLGLFGSVRCSSIALTWPFANVTIVDPTGTFAKYVVATPWLP